MFVEDEKKYLLKEEKNWKKFASVGLCFQMPEA